MPKTRFTAADVAAEVACLRATCLGHRCANVYDINARTYLLKLSQSGSDAAAASDQAEAEGRKTMLLLESGTRFHTTQFSREKARAPPSALAPR
jgi:predicted ribosome quality control (RQC) complex YloA/Tae2 family protein